MTLLAHEQSTGAALFARVLVGVDRSDAGLQAAFQAGRLVAPEGTLELTMALYLIDAKPRSSSRAVPHCARPLRAPGRGQARSS